MSKVLKLLWHTFYDTISLAPQITVEHITFPKREILQSSSATFDQLRFITPVTIKAKILLQQLWKLRVDWDEPLNSDLPVRLPKTSRKLHALPILVTFEETGHDTSTPDKTILGEMETIPNFIEGVSSDDWEE